jgi:16S rRNA (cytosine967-C5)-methyltransferase
MTDARSVALDVLLRVDEDGAWADRAFANATARAGLDARDRALAARLAAGAVKGRRLLDAAVAALADRDPSGLDPVCRNAVRLGACQLLLLDRVPPHAAVSTAVDLARARRGAGAAGLVNALLRRVAADGRAWLDALPDATAADAALRRSYPDWIAEAWSAAYGPVAARALMDAGNEPPELALRINRLRDGSEARVEEELTGLGATLHRDPDAPDARVVEGAVDLAATRAFAAGDLVPMSRSAQRIAPLLAPEAGMRVLDACAAPGGKAGHLAALMGGGEGLVCVERDPGRAGQLADALRRQGVEGHELVCQDVLRLDAALAGFDRILLDAPCTGLGTVGSRPDLRWRREAADVVRLAAVQRRMVDLLIGRLAPGGVLVLALCTLGTAEAAAADGHPVDLRLELRPDRGAGEGFTAVRLSAAP